MSTDAPKRNIVGMRPKGGGPVYAPQRDLAYLYAPALGEALAFLSPNVLDEFHKMLMEDALIPSRDPAEPLCTTDDLCAAISAFMKAHDLFTGEPKEGLRYASPHEALTAAGFFDCKPLARMMIYEKLGAVMAAGFFIAVRDVTGYYDVPPPEVELASILAAGNALCKSMSAVPPTGLSHGAAVAKETGADLELLRAQLQQEQKRVALKDEERKLMKANFAQMQTWSAHSANLLEAARTELMRWKERPLWRRLLNLAPAGSPTYTPTPGVDS